MAGMEKGNTFRIQGQLWNRQTESADDDDNPDISDYMGRAEVAGFWNVNKDNTLTAMARSGWSGSRKSATAAPRAGAAACAFIPSCSAATATRWWTTTGFAPC